MLTKVLHSGINLCLKTITCTYYIIYVSVLQRHQILLCPKMKKGGGGYIGVFCQNFVLHFSIKPSDFYENLQDQSLCGVDMSLAAPILIMCMVGKMDFPVRVFLGDIG